MGHRPVTVLQEGAKNKKTKKQRTISVQIAHDAIQMPVWHLNMSLSSQLTRNSIRLSQSNSALPVLIGLWIPWSITRQVLL